MNTVQWHIAITIDGLKGLGQEDITKGPVADLQALLDNWDHFSRDEVDGYLEHQADCLAIMAERAHGPETLTLNGAAINLRSVI